MAADGAGVRIDVILGRCDDMRAEVYVRATGLPPGETAATIGGTLSGPETRLAITLPTVASLADLGPGPGPRFDGSALARGILTEPGYWTPELPHRYRLHVEVRAGGGVIASCDRLVGLRRLGVRGRSLWLEGRRWVPRGVACTPGDQADGETRLPEQDALAVDSGNPRRFPQSTTWKKVRDDFFHGQPADGETRLPEQDAQAVDSGNPRRFPQSTTWKKVRDDFFHGQLAPGVFRELLAAAVIEDPAADVCEMADAAGVAIIARCGADPVAACERWARHASVMLAVLPAGIEPSGVAAVAEEARRLKGLPLLAIEVDGAAPPPPIPAGIDCLVVSLAPGAVPHPAWREPPAVPVLAMRAAAGGVRERRAACDRLQADLAAWRGEAAASWDWAGYSC
jgi:hypothetical protein